MIRVMCRSSDNSAVLRDLVERAIVEHRVSVQGASPLDVARAFGYLAAWPGNAPMRDAVQRERQLKAHLVAAAWELGIELVNSEPPSTAAPASVGPLEGDCRVFEIARVCCFACPGVSREAISSRIASYYDIPQPTRRAFERAIIQHLGFIEAQTGRGATGPGREVP